jgi:hypothetical protein
MLALVISMGLTRQGVNPVSINQIKYFKDQIKAVSPARHAFTPGLLAAKVGVHRLMEM